MLGIVIAAMLAAANSTATNSTVTEASSMKGKEAKYCRNMVIGASRSGDISICRTKAHWAAWDACQGVTRYCSPEQKKAISAKYTAFAMNEDSRVTCRIVKGTGSRLRATRMCMAQREWQRMWDDGQEKAHALQDTYSKKVNGIQ